MMLCDRPPMDLAQKPNRRFWKWVDIRGEDECWPWMSAISDSDYGLYRPYGSKIRFRAHRVALEQAIGPIGELLACHTCDNKRCCNPRHLYAGTHVDNGRDASERNQLADQSGEKNGNSKLTEKQVDEIRERIKAGDTNKAIAKEYGVHHATISLIRLGRSWAQSKNVGT